MRPFAQILSSIMRVWLCRNSDPKPVSFHFMHFTFSAKFSSKTWRAFTAKSFSCVSHLTNTIVQTRAAAAGILFKHRMEKKLHHEWS